MADTTLFEGIVSLLEAGLTAVLALIFFQAGKVIGAAGSSRSWRTEDMLSLTVTGGIVALGLGGIYFGGVSLRSVARNYVVLLAAYTGGATWGAAAGGAVTFVAYFGHPLSLSFVGAYTLAGLAGGAMREWRKVGVIFGFIAATAVTAASMGTSDYIFRMLAGAAVAGVVLALTARGTRSKIYRLLPLAAREESDYAPTYSARLQQLAGQRLCDLCAVFLELSETFSEPPLENRSPDQTEAAHKLMERLASDVCEECQGKPICWDKEFYKTYQDMLGLLAFTDVHGRITADHLPPHLRRRCQKPRELIRCVNSLAALCRQGLYWERRASDTRRLVGVQLQGVAKIMAMLSRELNLNVEYLRDIGERIVRELALQGVYSPQVEVVKGQNGRIGVSITKHACGNGENHCATVLVPLVTSLVGRQVSREGRCASLQRKTKCSVHLSTAHVLATETGIAQLAASPKVSGDSYRVTEIVGGKLALMVSDGMGNGPLARQESRTVINLLEQMLRAGFDKEVTVQTINSVLALRSHAETFATLDMALVDLYTGNVEVVKIGASSSYLRRGDRVEVVRADSLPAGILANIEVETRKLTLQRGDIYVLVSDGVLEGQQGIVDREEWLCRILRQATMERAQDLAEYILNRAKNNLGGSISDDMTVIILRVLDKTVSIPLVGCGRARPHLRFYCPVVSVIVDYMDRPRVRMDVTQAVRLFAAEQRLLSHGDHLLVGVSGGADSVALLLCLHELAASLALKLTVAHLNHGLRGQDADEDAHFVAKLCGGLAIPVVTGTADVAARRKSSHESLQQAARVERFRFFAAVVSTHGPNKVALAHHQGDQAETILLNLIRGAGLQGLGGMKPLERGLFGLTLIRPLLSVKRADILAFLAERGQGYRDDYTNLDTRYRRNLVRHEVLPLLSGINRDVDGALLRVGDHARAADDYICMQAAREWQEAYWSLPFGTGLRIDVLRACHGALGARLLGWAYAKEHAREGDIESAHIEACWRLLDRQVGRRINLPGYITVLRMRSHLVFYCERPLPDTPYELELPLPGEVHLPDGSVLTAEPVEHLPGDYPSSSAPVAYVAGVKLLLKVRNRRPGDTYIPLGASGHKKLKRSMSEAEIPLPWRSRLPVVVADGRVVWVPGLRIAREFRVPETGLGCVFKLTYLHGGKNTCSN